MLCYPHPPTSPFPPVGSLLVACLESLPHPLACFDDPLISEESGITVRFGYFFYLCLVFAFEYNTAPPPHITRCHFDMYPSLYSCDNHPRIYNMRPTQYSTRNQARDHSPIGVSWSSKASPPWTSRRNDEGRNLLLLLLGSYTIISDSDISSG